jgi:hypothetical protein
MKTIVDYEVNQWATLVDGREVKVIGVPYMQKDVPAPGLYAAHGDKWFWVPLKEIK